MAEVSKNIIVGEAEISDIIPMLVQWGVGMTDTKESKAMSL